ncbi:MAG TPA: peptidoglycan recognition family protein [Candidatus Saccharimonadales bacterium]|nr:peptidoglycan recognition family protein [Candidatus Saccharimonadales bacterium]
MSYRKYSHHSRIIKLLKDDYIGWHAGDWGINTRSIAIVLDGNYNTYLPMKKQIDAMNLLIHDKYANIKKENILTHKQIDKSTVCPGQNTTKILQKILSEL